MSTTEESNEGGSLYDRFSSMFDESPTETSEATEEASEDEVETEETEDDQQAEGFEDNNKESEEVEGQENQESEDGEDDITIYDYIKESLGIEVDGEFEEDADGYKSYAQAVYQKSQSDYEQALQEKYPEVYQAFVHVKNGGSMEDLVSKEKDIADIEIGKEDFDVAKNVMKNHLRRKGIDDESIKLIIESAEDQDKIITKAKAFQKQYKEEIAEEKKELIQQQEARAKQLEERRLSMANTVKEKVGEGRFDFGEIPKKEREKFTSHLYNNIQMLGDGSFVVVSRLSPEELESQIQYEYFRYKKGDLSDLITKRAKTLNVKNLKKKGTSSSSKGRKQVGGNLRYSEFE